MAALLSGLRDLPEEKLRRLELLCVFGI